VSDGRRWYPVPDEPYLFRPWDGDGWGEPRSVWFPTLQRGGRWWNASSFNGRSTLWSYRHPVRWTLVVVLVYAVATAVLVIGDGSWGFAFIAPALATFAVMPVWIGRRRWQAAARESLAH